jgi:hypothetical protein
MRRFPVSTQHDAIRRGVLRIGPASNAPGENGLRNRVRHLSHQRFRKNRHTATQRSTKAMPATRYFSKPSPKSPKGMTTWATAGSRKPEAAKRATKSVRMRRCCNSSPQPTASRLRSPIENVLDFAKVSGWRDGDNPAAWTGNLTRLFEGPGHFFSARVRQKFPLELTGEHRPAEKISLAQLAAHFRKQIGSAAIFDSFGNDR